MALTKVIGAGIGTVTNQFADANMATGTPVQIVQGNLNTAVSTTSTSFADVGLSATIVPSSTSNKVLVTVVLGKVGQSNTNGSSWKIFRGSDVVIQHSASDGNAQTQAAFHISNGIYGASNPDRYVDTPILNFLDSPSSTSSLVYKIQWKVDGGTAYLNRWATNTDMGSTSTITLTEIIA
tara:strand:- start:345 stop:884 length:540 start_codon:yes stop_codon:yes gene_type:complete